MDWIVKKIGNPDSERYHLNRILQDIDTALIAKEAASTGEVEGGALSINASDSSKLDVAAGYALFVDYTDPRNPTGVELDFGPFVGVTMTYIATQPVTYIGINSSGAVVQSIAPFTNTQRRDIVSLGIAVHSNNTIINTINTLVAPGRSLANQLHDFMAAIGPLNESGNKYSANGANLNLNKTAGTIFKMGSNFHVDLKNPHQTLVSAGTALTFRYRLQDSTEYTNATAIDPAYYDLNGVRTAMPLNKFQIQRVNLFQSGITRIQYGQNVYNTLSDAFAAFDTENFVTESNIAENGIFRCYLIVKEGCTNLTDTTKAMFLEVGKFGNTKGAAGGVLTFAEIVAGLGYTPENITNKVTSLSSPTNDQYPSALLLSTTVNKPNTVTAASSSAGVLTLDLSLGCFFTCTLTENITSVVFSNAPSSGFGTAISIQFTQHASAAKTITGWPANLKWFGGTYAISTATGAIDEVGVTYYSSTAILGKYAKAAA